MTREEILPIAKKHGFGGFEVGVRMVGLVNEILIMALAEVDIEDLHQQVHENDKPEAQ